MIRILILSACAAVAGCASVPSDGGFRDVKEMATGRTGLTVEWNGRTTDDRAVEQKVRELLAGELTADQAAQIALLNNRHMQATFEDLGIAQADLVQAGMLKNPVFDVGVRFPDHGPSGTYLDIGAAEDFLDIAMIPAKKKVAEARFAGVKANVANEVLNLACEARQAFYEAQAAALAESAQQSMADAGAAGLLAAEKLRAAGNISDLDLDRQRAANSIANINLSDARGSATEARERLADVMGIWDATIPWKIAPQFSQIPAMESSVAGLEYLALDQRQDIAAARQEVVADARMLGITSDWRWMDSLDAGPEFERETDGQWRIGPSLSFPLPLFDQGQARAARGEAMLRQATDRYEALRVDARAQVRQAANRLLHARARAIEYRDELLPAESDLMHQMELQYNSMFTGVFELLETRRSQMRISLEFIEAQRDYWIARAQLEQAIGGRLENPSSATRGS